MSEDEKPRKQFTPGSIVRVRGQLMGVGKASLLGLLDEAEDINDITQAERIAAQQGVALEAAEGESLTSDQEDAADVAEDKAKRAAVIKRGDSPADVDAEQADAESKLGETSKPSVTPGTIGDGEPPAGTDEGETGRTQADASEDPEAGEPDISDKATDAEVDAADAASAAAVTEAEAGADAAANALDAEVNPEVTEDGSPAEAQGAGVDPEPEAEPVELTRGQKAAQTRAANKAAAEADLAAEAEADAQG